MSTEYIKGASFFLSASALASLVIKIIGGPSIVLG